LRIRLAIFLGTSALVVAVGADDGGFFPRTWRWLSLVLFAAAGAALVLRERVALSKRDGIALGTLFALAAWALSSRAWSAVPQLAGPEAERTLAYAGVLLTGLVLIEPAASAAVPAGVLAASTILSAWAIGDYASSHLRGEPLVGPLGYANGAAALAAVGAVLAVGLAAAARRARARLVLLAPVPLLVATVVLARSAGAAIALAVGLLVVAAPHARRLQPRLLALGAGGIVLAAVAVWLALGHPAGGLTGNIRWTFWRAALEDYRGRPVLGSGAGDFGHYWGYHRTRKLGALDAHSLYVESLEELGPLGLALVLAFVGVVFRAAWRAGPDSAAVAGGFAVWVVHAGIDWDWELPAVTLPAVLLGAVALVQADAGRAKALRVPVQISLAAVATALAVLAVVRLKT
jgi:O-antigen ligase